VGLIPVSGGAINSSLLSLLLDIFLGAFLPIFPSATYDGARSTSRNQFVTISPSSLHHRLQSPFGKLNFSVTPNYSRLHTDMEVEVLLDRTTFHAQKRTIESCICAGLHLYDMFKVFGSGNRAVDLDVVAGNGDQANRKGKSGDDWCLLGPEEWLILGRYDKLPTTALACLLSELLFCVQAIGSP
jgi:hypothetical protein